MDLNHLLMLALAVLSNQNPSTRSHLRQPICGRKSKPVGTVFSLMLGKVTLNLAEDPLGPLRRKDGDPAFDDAWQAQSLAMADTLVGGGGGTATGGAEGLSFE